MAESFDADWLALREPADHRARAPSLLEPLEAWCRARAATQVRRAAPTRAPLGVVDLGTGTGSNVRYLAPHLPAPHDWTLVDHDRALLDRALGLGVERVRGAARVVPLEGDLGREGLEAVSDADLATASALLDLVSEPWLERLVAACATARCAALFALSWDGMMAWSGPTDPDDALALAAFAAHQRRDKGTGAALGPTAALVAAQLFQHAGYRTELAQSPWRLGPPERRLTRELLDGWEAAAVEQRPDDAARLGAWAARRRGALEGAFGLTVGHLDLLALPPDR